MLQLDYHQFGGEHAETANLANMLAYHGIKSPQSGEPLTEALVFGIAGGIGAGYSYCPSVPARGNGAGVSIIGRHLSYATGPDFVSGALKRLGVECSIRETTSQKTAQKHLQEALEQGSPILTYIGKTFLPYLGLSRERAAYCWSHNVVVIGIDEDLKTVALGDCAPEALSVPLDDFQAGRASVCSYKNRSLTFQPPKKLSATQMKNALEQGLAVCVDSLISPKMKGWSIAGFEDWAHLLTNEKNERGWPVAFKGSLLSSALRDAFESIETAGTGGGLFRGLFAAFLDESGEMLRKKTWHEAANHYRALAEMWSNLAESILPDRIPVFREMKSLLKQQQEGLRNGGKSLNTVRQAGDRLVRLQQALREKFPLPNGEVIPHLTQIRDQLTDIIAAEKAAVESLKKLVK